MSAPPLPSATASSTSWCTSAPGGIGELPEGSRSSAVLLEEEGRLAVGVVAHLAGVVGVVAADAVDAADREAAALPAMGSSTRGGGGKGWSVMAAVPFEARGNLRGTAGRSSAEGGTLLVDRRRRFWRGPVACGFLGADGAMEAETILARWCGATGRWCSGCRTRGGGCRRGCSGG